MQYDPGGKVFQVSGVNLIRILIADDHPVVRQGLRAMLVEQYGMMVIGEAEDGAEAAKLARELVPDVIVLDLVMPTLSGTDTIHQILSHNPDARILVLSSFGKDEMALEALRAGALGFLPKESRPKHLIQAIEDIHRGQLTIPLHLARALYLSTSKPSPPQPLLTEREEEILRAISKGSSNQQIADQFKISTNTVRTHLARLLRKLNFSNRTELAIYALNRDTRLE